MLYVFVIVLAASTPILANAAGDAGLNHASISVFFLENANPIIPLDSNAILMNLCFFVAQGVVRKG